MLDTIPTYIWPFVLAVVAFLVARMFANRDTAEPNALVRNILYAVAIGCVIIGIATAWLSHMS